MTIAKKILIINGNPAKLRTTLSEALAHGYGRYALEAGHQVEQMKLADLAFDPIQHEGYTSDQPLEPDLLRLREVLVAADHIVMVFPIWYALPPALFKGFIERMFTKGFAFEYHGMYPVALPTLKGKTVRLIITCSMPHFIYRWFSGRPAEKAMRTLFGLCGMKVSGITEFGGIADQSPQGALRYSHYIESLQIPAAKAL